MTASTTAALWKLRGLRLAFSDDSFEIDDHNVSLPRPPLLLLGLPRRRVSTRQRLKGVGDLLRPDEPCVAPRSGQTPLEFLRHVAMTRGFVGLVVGPHEWLANPNEMMMVGSALVDYHIVKG